MSDLETSPVSKSMKSVFTLNDARSILVAALGDHSEKYFMHVREWFKLRTSKKVIDTVARRCLKHEGLMCYHEVFIQTLLNKVIGLEEESLDAAHEKVFPGGLVCPRLSKYYRPASPVQPSQTQDTDVNMTEVTMAKYSCLPSQEQVHCRLILTSLEHELQQVEPDVAELVLEATRTLLKNVLTAIVDDVAPYKRCSWSHIYHVEPSTSMKCKQILYKKEEAYDKETLINITFRGNALLGLIPKEPASDKDNNDKNDNTSPEVSTDVSLPSNGPQPEETTIRLTSSNVFEALKRTPRIIPHRNLLALTVARAAMNIRHDKIICGGKGGR